MTLQEFISWLTRPKVTVASNLATLMALPLAVEFLLIYLLDRLQRRDSLPQVLTHMSARTSVAPKTWWECRTNHLELSPKARRRAQACTTLAGPR